MSEQDSKSRTNSSESNWDALPSVLAQTGLILTPAGVIALLCQALDVSARATAVTSLASVLLISICIYRRIINRYIPSTLLTASMVGLGLVFFFGYQHILWKDTGLIKYYKHSNDFLADLDSQITHANAEIWFVGTNFNITVAAVC
jgi:hypothetical protein